MMASIAGVLALYALPAIAGYISIIAFGGANTLGIRFARFGEQVLAITPLLVVGTIYLRGRKLTAALCGLGTLCLLMICSLGRTNIALFVVAVIGSVGIAGLFATSSRRRKLIWPVLVVVVAPLVLLSLPYFAGVNEAPVVSRMGDKEGLSDSNGFRKLMVSLSLDMIAERPLTGIGADNFGMRINDFREKHALSSPYDANLAQSENELPERAHNEYLQILAEVGLVGGAIFAWFLSGVGYLLWRLLREFKRVPPHAAAAIAGIGLFLLSSMVSSYSFRLIQNGFIFFFVLAVASKLLLKKGREDDKSVWVISGARLQVSAACGLVACVLLAGYSIIRVTSVIVASRANFEQDFELAEDRYRLAMRLDDENPYARNHYGMRLFHLGRFSEAVPLLRDAIDSGLATSTAFSYLAAAEGLTGNQEGAEATMRRAKILYPRSVFVLTRYALILADNGKYEESAAVFADAVRIDRQAAATWKALITQGAHRVSSDLARGAEYYKVMDLQPSQAVYSVITERLIKHPEERKFSLLSVGANEIANTGPTKQLDPVK